MLVCVIAVGWGIGAGRRILARHIYVRLPSLRYMHLSAGQCSVHPDIIWANSVELCGFVPLHDAHYSIESAE